MGSPFSTKFVNQLEHDIVLLNGYLSLDGYSNVLPTLPSQALSVANTCYTRLYGAQYSIGSVNPVAFPFLQPHQGPGKYVLTLDEPWLCLLNVDVTLAAVPGSGPVAGVYAPSFAILAGTGITNTGTTTINGDVGTFPTASETGFSTVIVNGVNHAGDLVTQNAKLALTAAYVAAQALPGAVTIATDLSGQTLTPGVYSSLSGTFTNTGGAGGLTLNGAGNYTFQAASTFIVSTDGYMVLENGASAANVTFAVGSSATLGTSSVTVGNILALTSITANTGAVVNGRLLAQNGAVTLQGNTVSAPSPGPSGALFHMATANVTGLASGKPGGDSKLLGGNLPGTDPSQPPQTVTIQFFNAANVPTDPTPYTGVWVTLVLKRGGAIDGD